MVDHADLCRLILLSYTFVLLTLKQFSKLIKRRDEALEKLPDPPTPIPTAFPTAMPSEEPIHFWAYFGLQWLLG